MIMRDTVITSVHVWFDESIPERSADYFKELDDTIIVKVDSEERSVDDINWLVGKYHMEDGLFYKTTRVVVRKTLVVGHRSRLRSWLNGCTKSLILTTVRLVSMTLRGLPRE
jgi:hypothetical protein